MIALSRCVLSLTPNLRVERRGCWCCRPVYRYDGCSWVLIALCVSRVPTKPKNNNGGRDSAGEGYGGTINEMSSVLVIKRGAFSLRQKNVRLFSGRDCFIVSLFFFCFIPGDSEHVVQFPRVVNKNVRETIPGAYKRHGPRGK